MNTRSLSFRLIAWYASLLAILFLLLGAVTFAAVANYLQVNLRENQTRRARQIADTLVRSLSPAGGAQLGATVEALYAPSANDRFIRITRADAGETAGASARAGGGGNGESGEARGAGQVLFQSGEPRDHGFDPARVPRLAAFPASDSWRKVELPGGATLMIAAVAHRAASGTRYIVEVGAPTAPIDATITRLAIVLGAGFPVAMLFAVTGGFLLVRRALAPVDRIAQKAEAITQHSLSERLPVAESGDEIERLSVSLNHMINRLEEAVQSSKRFVADASHELRTPLTVLRGELESLMAGREVSVRMRETLGSLLEEVDRLAAVVEGLLALSRLDTGEARSEWVRFDLGELVATTADQMGLLAEDKSIAVVCEARRGVWVEGDRARMKQVVVNLLDNAIKYTPNGGAVHLRVAREDGAAVFEIADNGIGIPRDAQPHVFERFFRVERSRTRDQGGAGLGLSIVKSICTAHGASVELESSAENGSRFRVRQPLASPSEPLDPPSQPQRLSVP
ncbi:MAG TPA: HAMP domain-containing sensor histidine kinase [Steroidobacteraceae bacterium]|nr:HAMP domain-containing sensor histidine kinase [Steroidobacteraceae bacterium]